MYIIRIVNGIIIRNNSILLVLKNDLWFFPGGKVKNESDIECLCREFDEELSGTKIKNHRYYKDFKGIAPYGKYPFSLDAYFVDIDGSLGKPSSEIRASVYADILHIDDYDLTNTTMEMINSLISDGYLNKSMQHKNKL